MLISNAMRLTLEITESTVMADVANTIRVLRGFEASVLKSQSTTSGPGTPRSACLARFPSTRSKLTGLSSRTSPNGQSQPDWFGRSCYWPATSASTLWPKGWSPLISFSSYRSWGADRPRASTGPNLCLLDNSSNCSGEVRTFRPEPSGSESYLPEHLAVLLMDRGAVENPQVR